MDKPDAPQSQIWIGEVGVASTAPDIFPVRVMNNILGGTFNSRLNGNLRTEHAYSYGVFSFYDVHREAGPFIAAGGVVSDKTAAALGEFLKQLTRMKSGEVVRPTRGRQGGAIPPSACCDSEQRRAYLPAPGRTGSPSYCAMQARGSVTKATWPRRRGSACIRTTAIVVVRRSAIARGWKADSVPRAGCRRGGGGAAAGEVAPALRRRLLLLALARARQVRHVRSTGSGAWGRQRAAGGIPDPLEPIFADPVASQSRSVAPSR